MKNLLLFLLFFTGCTTYYEPVAVIQKPIQADALSRTLSQSQIQASQLNQQLSGICGPNNVSAAILDYQNANRNLNAILQNPWNGFFTLRNLWLP
jgi:hypothetical protein